MLLPSELISTTGYQDAKCPSLYLSVDQQYSLMWILQSGTKRYGLHLNGDSARTGFEIGDQQPGYGVQIYPVSIRVNPTSAKQNGIGWNLQAANQALLIGFLAQSPSVGGQPQQVWAPVATITSTINLDPALHMGVYFSEWSAGVEVDGQWIELITATSHDFQLNPDLTTPVL